MSKEDALLKDHSDDVIASDDSGGEPKHCRRWHAIVVRGVKSVVTSLSLVILPFAILIAIWEALSLAQVWSPTLFPPPTEVFAAGVQQFSGGPLWTDIRVSLSHLGFGVLLGAVCAVPLGVIMGLYRVVGRLTDPLVSFFQAIPGLAWIPLAILWFGLSGGAIVFIIFVSAFFPLLFNTIIGVRSTDGVLINAVLTIGGKRRHILWHVVAPSALPIMMTGLRLSIGYGFRALIAGEMLASSSGLGFMIFQARNYLQSDVVILGMIVIGCIWLLIDRGLLKPIERRTSERWGTVTAQ